VGIIYRGLRGASASYNGSKLNTFQNLVGETLQNEYDSSQVTEKENILFYFTFFKSSLKNLILFSKMTLYCFHENVYNPIQIFLNNKENND